LDISNEPYIAINILGQYVSGSMDIPVGFIATLAFIISG
jgi:hypothetical protein